MRPIENPRHRFESQYVEWLEEPPPAKLEVHEETATREILARNDSPDVGFTWSLNPYRGCTHACAYCMSGETPILMADGSAKQLARVQVGDAIYGTVRDGAYRRLTRATVLAAWSVIQRAWRVTLEDGRSFVAGPNHRFLTRRGWKYVTPSLPPGQRPHLTTNDRLMGTGASFVEGPPDSEQYRAGWLCGMVRGDAHLATHDYSGVRRGRDVQHHFRLALVDGVALERAASFLDDLGIETHAFLFKHAVGMRRAMHGIRTHVASRVNHISDVVRWPAEADDDWWKGFLAGIFDAEGSYSHGVLRISNTDDEIIGRLRTGFARFGFDVALEHPPRAERRPITVVRLRGGMAEALRFFQLVGPAITRKTGVDGAAVKARPVRVTSIEDTGVVMRLHDITTTTGDFIADGVVSHNCYARPSHEYLGFGAGTDFETRIVAKVNAPELLRKKLASKSWTGEAIAFSGDTDCYQPIEASYGLTRACLQVCRDFGNPVLLITKSFLVSRDAALLADLSQRARVTACMSIAFADDEMSRLVEPGAPRPSKRIEALRILADMGVRTGVIFAPIIPGLNEDQIPAVLERAKEAGAQFASRSLLRLPHSVKEVFFERMRREMPDRVKRIESRLREVRGGALNDASFGSRMRGKGTYWDLVDSTFRLHAMRLGLLEREPEQLPPAPRPPAQMRLFS